MRVKRLEIQGFKSFKDKTVIHFDHGITGIVGPNGCGKSNIVDAFFWVMGEQSYKHMRGSGSDDLIFNGSSKYSPLGLAEATMVLETDYATSEDAPAGATTQDVPVHLRSKEIAVTRRLYRGGEGEYFINGVHARLKDIQELFMDTGVGAKGYSVIEQGQIGKIVNAKPEDRRLLIEEAAGIAKYKARKKESLRKMEATQANLSRLTDVIQEIERSLGSLERQAQKARQYKKYKDELLDKEMTWDRRKNQVLRQKLEELKKQKEALEQELVGLRAELQVAENSIETDRVEQVTDTKAAEDLQAQIQNLSDELTRERSALDLSRRRQSDLTSRLESLETEKNELQTSIETESQRISEKEKEAEEANQAFHSAAQKAQSNDESVRKFRQETEAARRELDNHKKDLMIGITRSSELSSKAASLLSRMESARAQAERLSQQVQQQQEKLASSRGEAEKAVTATQELASRRELLQGERKEQSTQIQAQEQAHRQSERERDESQRSLTQLKSRLQSLEELAAAHEGFGDGPKAALDWAKESGSAEAFTAIANCLDVSAGYESALEGWLEDRLEDLVAQDPTVAIRAIEHLSNEKQGRAIIHVLDESAAAPGARKSAAEVTTALSSAGFEVVGELGSFVKVSESVKQGQAMIATLLRDVCVVKSLSPAAQFLAQGALSQLGNWSIVSMEGNVLSSDGTVRGGSFNTEGATSIIRRRQAIAELKEAVVQAEAQHAETEQSVSKAKQALDLSRARLQTLQAEIQALDIEAAALNRDVHQMNRAVKDAESQLELMEIELKEMHEDEESSRAERERIEGQMAEIIASRSELEARIATGDSELTTKEAEVRAQESEVQALRVNEASLRERAVSLKRELEASRALISDRERRLQEINRTLERAVEEKEQFTGGDSHLERKIEDLTRALGETREKLAAVKDRLEQSSAKINGSLDRIKHLHHTGDTKTAESNQLAIEVEKLSSDLAHLIQNLEEKYGPGCLERPAAAPVQEEMPAPIVTTEMSAEEEQILGEEVERLRERIRRLGEVNVMAIEEYEELKKRYDYLLNEKADLERSIENLQEAIEHINKTSEERFRKAFEAIADRFERLFPIIFGGGQAKLSLVYPEGSTDILEAGVDILAQPPGKKVVNIGLLSGGEKALTAVSLIFAIFMVKPSPFCVLDEVDAPLDDANIGKFNALLREMSAKSQFILITHNKKTMELNDTLYGVTMEEPGVSKMVSIEMH